MGKAWRSDCKRHWYAECQPRERRVGSAARATGDPKASRREAMEGMEGLLASAATLGRKNGGIRSCLFGSLDEF